MKIRIGIDGRVFIGNRTGVSHYISELCLSLDRLLPDAEFIVYNRDSVELPVKGDNWVIRTESSSLRKKLPNILWQKFVSGFLCRRDRIDVYWGAGSFLPFFLGRIKTVITVYDLVYRIAPATMCKFAPWIFRLFFKRDVLKAAKITTISKGTSERLRHFIGRSPDAIVYPSVNKMFVRSDEREIRGCLDKYGITRPYFLSVATWEPRKNLPLLIKTFLNMKQRGELGDYQLVLPGGRGWKDDEIAAVAGEEGDSDILSLGYVPSADLAPLYSGARAFIFPSIYEGFGMPVLEAGKCGVPVITSDIPELREAGGSGAIYIEPTADGIRNGILRCLNGECHSSSADLITHTWEDGAEKMAQVFINAVNSGA